MVQICDLSKAEPRKDLCILLTSHPKGQLWMEAGLLSWKHSGLPILLGYDDKDTDFLPKKIKDLVDYWFVTGERSGHVGGELRQFKLGAALMKEMGFEYFFKSAADTTTYRHTAFKELHELLADNDFARDGTSIVYGKVDSLVKLMEPFASNMKVGAAELYFGNVGKDLGLTSVGLPRKDWNYKLGRVHIQGEYAKYHFGGKVAKTWEIGEIWKRS